MQRMHAPRRLLSPRWIALILLCAPLAALADATRFDQGLLWKVERAGAPTGYIFGTIHVDDPRVTKLPSAVTDAFANVKGVATEMLLDETTIAVVAAAMFIHGERGLPDIAGAELFERAVPLLEKRGIPREIARRLRPWAAATTLVIPPGNGGGFLDERLYADALHAGKDVHGLEQADEQIAIFEGLPEEDQVAMLADAVDQNDQIAAMYAELVDAWLARDLGRLVQLNEKYMPEGPDGFATRFMESTIYARNDRMVERMLPLLRADSTFVAVGALHLPGERGILSQLASRGYTLTRVY